MRLTILHVSGCPGARTLRDRLGGLIGAGDVLTVRVVDREDVAREVGMAGSPTLLVDGVDPFAGPGCSVGLSCRLYRDASGHLAGSPSVAQLREVLGRAAATGHSDR
ncbi:hypothetical protein I6A60_17015 [Frankia sp. AgB1.9]|uniref:thioredoxin family protein n=1 Tax=unclassified Frankia TaxID=2632575 RepID=UPI0019339004|nr:MULTISPECIES: thioredoxin family protein [unclassified Frankia]MBL7493331.1 hypothetical protein [Frankia sp. AgW1.1]MBL7549563.1 hypothetical protein [Frankia sp. AgB1.9]MBL7620457.1 thioredoxin family protein [Frankia sp. AgB1.8]